jgi:hypothetical protein
VRTNSRSPEINVPAGIWGTGEVEAVDGEALHECNEGKDGCIPMKHPTQFLDVSHHDGISAAESGSPPAVATSLTCFSATPHRLPIAGQRDLMAISLHYLRFRC